MFKRWRKLKRWRLAQRADCVVYVYRCVVHVGVWSMCGRCGWRVRVSDGVCVSVSMRVWSDVKTRQKLHVSCLLHVGRCHCRSSFIDVTTATRSDADLRPASTANTATVSVTSLASVTLRDDDDDRVPPRRRRCLDSLLTSRSVS